MRLTEKGFQFRPQDLVKITNVKIANIYNKLGQLEDLEEDFGVDLITIFKALKNGIYIKDHLGYIRKKYVTLDIDEGLLLFVSPDEYSGSGRTTCGCGSDWALTKEALE